MRDLVLIGLLTALLLVALYRPYVGVLIASWFSFMNPHQLSWGLAGSIPWAVIAFAATIMGCLVAREPDRPPINAVTLLLVLFSACITFTSLVAIAPDAVVWPMWERVIKVVLGLLLAAALMTDRWRIHAMVWVMVLSVGYFSVRGGIFTLVTGGGHIVLGPPNTMITDRNHLAVAMLVALPLMNYLRLHSAHKIVRTGLVVAMALTVFAAVGSQSRGAVISLAGGAAVMWYRSNAKITFGAIVVLAGVLVLAFMPDTWYQRIQSINDYEADRSAMGRVEIWIAAFNIAVARPLMGGGFRAPYLQDIVDIYAPGVTARATHSIWFEVIGEHGFVTFGVWLGIILAGVYYAMRIPALVQDRPDLRWASDLARMAQVSIVVYVLGGSFLSLSYWDLFWTLLIVLAATHAVVVQAVRQTTVPQRSRQAAMPTGAVYP